jgi:ribosomal-protein-alanine N-acetyltransferase
MTEKQTRSYVRWMIRSDLPEVVGIESASFEYAWTEEDFRRCLRHRCCIAMVVEFEDRIVGYTVYELHRDRLEVLNFAVHSDARRCGVGSALVAKLRYKLSSHRRQRITLMVRERNVPAQMFFRRLGFIATAIHPERYADSGEDAIEMEFYA